ncbi:phosphoglycerate mutase family protein [Mucilaginibacter galii]|nr:phosphoglycerate mutase family protein [Mucilaginibacter galii]
MFNKIVVILSIAALSLSNFDALAQKTTIWLVRHAEKETANPADRDPDLTAIGKSRASALSQVLKREKIRHIYSTIYKRTQNTAMPLAGTLKLIPEIYDTKDLTAVAQRVLAENKGKYALIVGHSNTLIPMIKALNCEVPFEELSDNDYDMLFKVIVDDKGKARLNISHYGDLHHTTEVPSAFSQGENPGTNTPIKVNN